MITLAIDPSINNTGIAVFENRLLVQTDILNGYELAVYLHTNLHRFNNVIVENSKKQKACWNKNYRSVGQVDAVCNIVIQAIQQYNKINKKAKINFIAISPKEKGGKVPYQYIQQEYPQFKVTQDVADAIQIGKMFLYMQ